MKPTFFCLIIGASPTLVMSIEIFLYICRRDSTAARLSKLCDDQCETLAAAECELNVDVN